LKLQDLLKKLGWRVGRRAHHHSLQLQEILHPGDRVPKRPIGDIEPG
jgi:hypothetical protein